MLRTFRAYLIQIIIIDLTDTKQNGEFKRNTVFKPPVSKIAMLAK